MLGRCLARWILITAITACGEQGYSVRIGGDGAPADERTQPSPGSAPTTDAVEGGSSTQPTSTSDVTTTCAGSGCSTLPLAFNPNDPYRQQRVIRGDMRGAENVRSRADCTGLGPDRIYELDLSAFSAPVAAYLHVRAGFDASLAIETGRRDDPFLVACNEDHAPGADDAFISAMLEPKPYRIVVDGEHAEASGEFELVVDLPSPTGRCAAPPPNDRCSRAIPLDPERPVQTSFGTTRCASDQAHAKGICGISVNQELDVFYSLDLTERTEPVLMHATTRLAPTDHHTVLFVTRDVLGECAEPLICADESTGRGGTELWANLEPGQYFLGVQSYVGSGDFGLSVELSAEPCAPANDTCQTAQAIEPTLGVQQIMASPGCGDDSIVTRCGGLFPSPDIFYRLDLSEFQGPVHVRAQAEAFSLVLMADGGGTCGNELYCGDIDLWLSPEVYYLALDTEIYQQGPLSLTVEIETNNPPAPADCIDDRIAACARAQRESCCNGDGSACSLVFSSCGLSSEALSCLCAADPDCCGGRGSSSECRRHLEECGTFCPGYDPALSCPEFTYL